MCGPIASIGLAIASSAANFAMASSQAAQQEKIANAQAQEAYRAANERVLAEYAEANRQISEAQQKEIEDASDLISQARNDLAVLTVADNGALSDSALGNIYGAAYYDHSSDLQRLDENTDKQIASIESNKGAAQQNYLNSVNAAKNQTQNVLMQTNANRNSAMLQIGTSVASAGTSAYRHQETIKALKA